ncbi:hypothetical protein QYZ87_10810 [Porphyromonadaceae bacterium W3.11]|nr:hypothetical protein [Porphyromonadaceae bacterium W3.11]
MEDKERTYELRSEKVRSIVGQIPPALVRYGTIILFAVLLVLFGIAYFMPYKQVYSGTITFYDISEPATTAYITFVNDKSLTSIDKSTSLTIHLEAQNLDVQLRSIENRRDTLNRYPVIIQVNKGYQNIANLKNSTSDFTLVESSDNLLSHILPLKRRSDRKCNQPED